MKAHILAITSRLRLPDYKFTSKVPTIGDATLEITSLRSRLERRGVSQQASINWRPALMETNRRGFHLS